MNGVRPILLDRLNNLGAAAWSGPGAAAWSGPTSRRLVCVWLIFSDWWVRWRLVERSP
jgi:hypothetical protein